MQRLLNLRRFLSGRRQYLELRLRQGVTGVASRREFELCRELKLSSVTGPFVSKLSDEPLQDQGYSRAELPFKPAKPVVLNQGLN